MKLKLLHSAPPDVYFSIGTFLAEGTNFTDTTMIETTILVKAPDYNPWFLARI